MTLPAPISLSTHSTVRTRSDRSPSSPCLEGAAPTGVSGVETRSRRSVVDPDGRLCGVGPCPRSLGPFWFGYDGRRQRGGHSTHYSHGGRSESHSSFVPPPPSHSRCVSVWREEGGVGRCFSYCETAAETGRNGNRERERTVVPPDRPPGRLGDGVRKVRRPMKGWHPSSVPGCKGKMSTPLTSDLSLLPTGSGLNLGSSGPRDRSRETGRTGRRGGETVDRPHPRTGSPGV